MNEENKDIINRFLLIEDKFMPEMHLWDPKVGKYSACGPFTRQKNKIYKHMTYIGKNVYFNVLDDIVKNYNNTSHSSIKMKPKDVKHSNLTEYIEEFNKKDPKFKIGDYVRISKYKNIFCKGYLPNWSEEIFIIN